MLLCLHEEHAVAIAHGYAKVTGQPMGAIVHSNVGLMHATMAIFNAWCDRVPVFVLGATGPVDAAKRRPWIDWIHTAQDQGALVRNYTKWDDQPASVAAAAELLLRAYRMMTTAALRPGLCLPRRRACRRARSATCRRCRAPTAFARRAPSAPDPAALAEAAALLQARRAAADPGRARLARRGGMAAPGRSWPRRWARIVLTDAKAGAGFPSRHQLQGPPAGNNPSEAACALIRQADVVLSLDWVDLAGAFKAACGAEPVAAKVISASLDHLIHNGWSMDYQGLPPVDLHLAVEPDIAVAGLLPLLRPRQPGWPERPAAALQAPDLGTGDAITPLGLAAALREAVGSRADHA